jgi:hypothetical protein
MEIFSKHIKTGCPRESGFEEEIEEDYGMNIFQK